MTDDALERELMGLGIDRDNYRVLALLPLVQVAWADGRIQRAEHTLIFDAASRLGLDAGGAWEGVLERWLAKAPTDLQFLRGQQALLALAHRRDPSFAISGSTLSDLVELSVAVAQAAGGLFGVAFQVEEAEERALDDIARLLCLGPEIDWSRLAASIDGP